MSTPKQKVLASGELRGSLADHARPKHQLKAGLRRLIVLLVVLFVSLYSQSLFAQQNGTASVSGVVADASGASIVGASVTVTNTATGVSISAKSNEAGVYTVLYLIAGNYNVEAKKEGFQTQVKSAILLTADRSFGLNFQLNPGSFTERVTVEANAQLVETESPALGQTVDEHTITELPLNGRIVASLVNLAPGHQDVLGTSAGSLQGNLSFPLETGSSADGGRQGSTYYLLDGAYNMDNYHQLGGPFPNPDAIQEFKVIGTNTDSQYGFSASVVSIATKSGTNSVHGVLFFNEHDKNLVAKPWFPPHQIDGTKNQIYGASIGGPLVKNKLFLFGNYQATRAVSPGSPLTMHVPSAAMLAGDFSGICVTGFDVNGICQDPGGVDQIYQDVAHTTPYKNNQITNYATAYSPTALYFQSLLPQTTDRFGKAILQSAPSIAHLDEFTIRMDYNLNDKQRIMLRSFNDLWYHPGTHLGLFSAASWVTTWSNQAVAHTWTISPALVNNVVAAFTRINDSSKPTPQGPNGKPLCYSQLIPVYDPPSSPCEIDALGVGDWFVQGNFNYLSRRTWSVAENLNIVKGKHLMVAGVDVLHQYWNLGTDWLATMPIFFDGTYTNNALADFLLGDVSGLDQDSGEYQQLKQTQIAPYFTDQIKLTPHFTITAGLRWEPWYAPTSTNGRMELFMPGRQSTRFPNAPLGLVFPGDAGVPSKGVPDSLNHWDPRIGFAWTPSFLPKTSIRAAFGSFSVPVDYSSWNHTADAAPFSPLYSLSHLDPVVGAISFDNPWGNYAPTGGKDPFPAAAVPPLSVPPSSVVIPTPAGVSTVFNPKYRGGQNNTWNVSVSRQFGTNWVAQAAYVGAEVYHLQIPTDYNAGLYFGPGDPNNGARKYANFSDIFAYDSTGTSSYQSGQFSLQKRFANGLQFQASYTRSRTLDTASADTLAFFGSVPDPSNLKNDYGVSDLSAPNIFVFNFVYHSPALSHSNLLIRSVLGGWESAGIWTAKSGLPFTVHAGLDNSFNHLGGDRADLVSGQQLWSNRGSKSQWTSVALTGIPAPGYYNTQAFAYNAQGTIGNSARNLFYGPGVNNWDLNLSKNWSFRERYRLQFRWEMFNAFNRVQMGLPCASVTCGPSQGQIFNTQNGPRSSTVALKIYF